MAIAQAQVGLTITTIVPKPLAGSYANVGIFFCNYHATNTVVVQVYVSDETGAKDDDSHSIMRDLTLAPKESYVLNVEKFLLDSTGGWSINAKADTASAVVATASYIAI